MCNKAFDAGIESLVQAETASGKEASGITYPSGWFGAGAFSNPGELVALTQLTLASFRGINTVFHNVAAGDMVTKRNSQLESAQRLFNDEVKPLLEQGATKAQVLAKIQEIAAREQWPVGDLNLD